MVQKKVVIYYFPFVLVLVTIFILSSLSSGSLKPFQFTDLFALDKIGHFLAYASLSFCYYAGFRYARQRAPQGREIWKIFAICAIYGVVLECGQLFFFTSRSYEFADMIANALGAGSGLAVARLFWR